VGTKQIDKAGPDYINENVTLFKKCDNGHYQKIDKIMVKDIKTNKTTLVTEVPGDLYNIVTSGDYDYEVKLQDPDGNDCTLRFKHV
jgi:hypothetical protein